MKLPRNSKILRSQFDVAPFAAVFFALLIFLLIGALLPVPGLRMSLQPPSATDLPGVDKPTVAMAVDGQGRLYYENQIVTEPVLKTTLAALAKGARQPLTLVIHADKAVRYEQLAHLALLARQPEIGITNLLLATLPAPAKLPARP
ncbi:MAG: biopolymer transporter ExbD [Verrucomicrobiota bacterium]